MGYGFPNLRTGVPQGSVPENLVKWWMLWTFIAPYSVPTAGLLKSFLNHQSFHQQNETKSVQHCDKLMRADITYVLFKSPKEENVHMGGMWGNPCSASSDSGMKHQGEARMETVFVFCTTISAQYTFQLQNNERLIIHCTIICFKSWIKFFSNFDGNVVYTPWFYCRRFSLWQLDAEIVRIFHLQHKVIFWHALYTNPVCQHIIFRSLKQEKYHMHIIF